MALKRSRSLSGGKWPEIETRVVPAAPGPGLVFQVAVDANLKRHESTIRVAADGTVVDSELAAMLRELAWMMDGKGEAPEWARAEQRRKAKAQRDVLNLADKIKAGAA